MNNLQLAKDSKKFVRTEITRSLVTQPYTVKVNIKNRDTIRIKIAGDNFSQSPRYRKSRESR